VFVELKTVQALAPEFLLILAATFVYVGGAFRRHRGLWLGVALTGFVLAGAALAMTALPSGATLTGPIVLDPMSFGLRWLALFMGVVLTLMAGQLADERLASEVFGSLMLATVGVMLSGSANELVLLFVGLELISIPTYVLLFLGRRDAASSEATMKYFYLSILSSAIMLYGFSFLYGLGKTTLLAGTPQMPGVRESLIDLAAGQGEAFANLAPLALVLIVAGLGFKLAAVPFHFYAPDVYEGTTNVNAGVLAVAPKIAAIAALVRVIVVTQPAIGYAWQLALVLALLTMTIGNVCALWQKNLRRMLAYSSIAHAGYLLIGLAAGLGSDAVQMPLAAGGTAATLFYVFTYALATLGSFAALAWLGSMEREINTFDDISGLASSRPWAAGAMAIFMFSLAGLPPLAGFWGKLTLFSSSLAVAMTDAPAGLRDWFIILAVAAALNAAIGAAYYLRVIAAMYFQPAVGEPAPVKGGPSAALATGLCALLVLVCAAPGWAMRLSQQAELSLHQSPASAAAADQTAALEPVRDAAADTASR
jgi:NADH-quinone oxidoreductase subunit N